MKKISVMVLVAWAMALVANAQVHVTNYTGNGTLTWASPSGSVCTIEWASSLMPEADWKRDWVDLSDVRSTNNQSAACVPMFYRVSCWTNGLFLSMPIGRTYVYRVTAIDGFTWTQEVSCVGFANGPTLTNGSHYVLLAWKQTGHPDLDASQGFEAMSASDQAAYALGSDGQVETRWQLGPIDMTWTNQLGGDLVATTIKTNETITVPAGIFSNATWYQQKFLYAIPETNDVWVKPGFFLLRYVDAEGEGDVLELESWRDE
jgi:hypothetical protein